MAPQDFTQLIHRVALFVGAWVAVQILVVGGILQPFIPGGWLTIILTATLAFVPVWVVARGFAGLSYPRKYTRLLVMRPLWYSMFFLPIVTGGGAVGAFAGLFAGMPLAGARWGVSVVGVAVTLMAIGGYLHSRALVVRRLEVRLPRLPRAFDGLRIVQISDLHVGPHTPVRHLARVADAVHVEQPDLIAITGDQVDDYADDVALFVSHFRGLSAPLGVFAIVGNHDVFAGWEGMAEGLSRAGLRVLVNEAVLLERQGERLWIAGTGDHAAHVWPRGGGRRGAPDILRTLAAVPHDEIVIALAHNPALWPALVERGVDLTLSGHTHAGQFAIPRLKWSLAAAFLELANGTYQRGDALLYINPGTNYWGIPFRLGTPPEVTVLTLRTGAAAFDAPVS